METMRGFGYSLSNPPADFRPPVDEGAAAGLNVLPGIGNFYLAVRGGGGAQWLLGAGNFLLWPFSPVWSVFEGYADARTINGRALVEYWKDHSAVGLSPAGSPVPVRLSPTDALARPDRPSAPPPAAESARAPFDVASVEPYANGHASYRVSILDPSKTAFDIERLVRPEIERVVRDAFISGNPGVVPETVRVSVVPDFGSDRTILFAATAFSAELASDGWTYNAETRRGTMQLRVGGQVDAMSARLWARQNIASIVRDKNVALSADTDTPPPGASFQSLNETFDKGILTVEFAVVD